MRARRSAAARSAVVPARSAYRAAHHRVMVAVVVAGQDLIHYRRPGRRWF